MAYRFLEDMYDCLVGNVKPKGTLFADLLSKKTTNLWKLLDKVKISSDKYKDMRLEINDAIQKGLISEDMSFIYITAKGIYAVEKEKGRFNIDEFIDFLNTKYFDVLTQKTKPLGDNKKTVLFFLISIRAFSAESCLDLNRSAADLDAMWGFVVNCAHFLFQLGAVKEANSINKVGMKNVDNEHMVFHLLRHAQDIQLPTDCIFTMPGESTYFLDVAEKGMINYNRLAFLFHKIFDKELQASDIDLISQFCNKISKESMFIVYKDINSHIFRELTYNNTTTDAMTTYNRKFF